MGVVVPSETDLDVLRSVARCGFDRAETVRVCTAAGWVLLYESPDAKVLQYRAEFGADDRAERVVTIHREDDMMAPAASVPLQLFRLNPAPDRRRLDRAFEAVADGLRELVGRPHRAGEYAPRHPTAWPFRYAWWRLVDAAVVLVQNQFDPDSDLDVSLWVFPPLDEVRLPVTEN